MGMSVYAIEAIASSSSQLVLAEYYMLFVVGSVPAVVGQELAEGIPAVSSEVSANLLPFAVGVGAKGKYVIAAVTIFVAAC